MKFQLIAQNTSLETIEADFSDKDRVQIGGEGSDILLDQGFAIEGIWLEIQQTDTGYLLRSNRDDVLVNDLLASTPIPLVDGDLVQIGEEQYSFALPEPSESPEPSKNSDEEETPETADELSDTEKEFLNTIANEGTERDTHSEESLALEDEDIFAASHASQTEEGTVSEIDVDLETSHWLLKVLTGPNSGAQMNLTDDKSYLIGSDPGSCDIVLTDLSVSKKHLRLTPQESGLLQIEDLNSRNGVLISGEKIKGTVEQENSALITAGATTFMVVDRLKEQQTLVTPGISAEKELQESDTSESSPQKTKSLKKKTGKKATKFQFKAPVFGKNIIALTIFVFVSLFVTYGIYSLFDEESLIIKKERGPGQLQELTALLEEYPYFDFQFSEATGHLELSGHILTLNEKSQLLSSIKSLSFIKKIETTNLIVDELVWQQFNLSLEKNFKGVVLSGELPGEFLLSGILKTQAQGEDLARYLSINFPYTQLLINRVVIEEQLASSINDRLQSIAPNELLGELNNGELVIVGTIALSSQKALEEFLGQLRTLPGINSVRNLVVEQSRDNGSGYIDISDQYEVTGFTKEVDANVNIIINGRILKRGDTLDQMTIISIRPRAVILERDQIKYRIEYNL